MSEEKKPDEKTGATALDDAVLETVSGGTKAPEQKSWADQAWDFAKEMFGANEDKEQQP